ncbi:class I SAM-dependent methyltransferase [Thermogemmatispora onikobensis]|uniref:class I SAM-dependent methyltransferase n=1 Tax=Thermogemmatispora onikobensis TaxID=732234 RepID=UPI000853650E|nr:class I SAM-dependent methyltransferase [Thermogemmatispora onikobensis]
MQSIHHPLFAAVYERLSRAGGEWEEALRREVVGAAQGHVLEVGAGTGLNFAYYDPRRVEGVEAVEPDPAMLRYAQRRQGEAPVPLRLHQARVEELPFANETFDSALATLVFCSVEEPARGFAEIRRVLKPGGLLLLAEHVRAASPVTARLQDLLTPLTRRCAGNCHWNRATLTTLAGAGLRVISRRDEGGGLMPLVIVRAVKE